VPAARERAQYLALNEEWGRANLEAFARERDDIDATLAHVRGAEGRVYPGLAAQWGREFKVGYVPFYALVASSHAPAVAFLYHAMSLPSDVMVHFNEQDPVHYRLFNVTTIVSETSRALP